MFCFLVITALAFASTANSQVATYVLGGQSERIESFPYQVSVQHYDGEQRRHICGGSIITEYYVLSAAHCFEYPADYYYVRAGSSYQNHGGSLHRVEELILHEYHYQTTDNVTVNDIALIKLKDPIEFDHRRRPIALYDAGENLRVDDFGTLTGWGETEDEIMPIVLKKIDVPIVASDVCEDAYAWYDAISEGMFCAGYLDQDGKGTCEGDSGGPLVVKKRLAGIVSFHRSCGDSEYPDVYTDVSFYHDWIVQHLQDTTQDEGNVEQNPVYEKNGEQSLVDQEETVDNN